MAARRRKNVWPRGRRASPGALLVALLITAAVAYSRWRGGATTSTGSGPDYERYNNRIATCTEVLDGDTLHVDLPDGPKRYTKVRLWGVDTPEVARPGQQGMFFGDEAREFVRAAIEGRSVRLVLAPEDTRDRYQRLLAYVYYAEPEEMLNERLIADGFGYADPRYKHPWKVKFLQAEERARRRRVGLWARVSREQMPEWRRRLD